MLVGAASHWSDMYGILPSDDPAKYTMDGKFLKSLPADFYSSRSYADFLMQAIRENRGDGKPFLAYLAFTAVHDPVQVPEPWLSKYRGRYDAGYEVLRTSRWEATKKIGVVPKSAKLAARHPMIEPWEDLPESDRAVHARGMEVYAGMLEAMDYHYGRVVDFLKDIGEYDNTVVIFLSDNGANPFYSDDYPGARAEDFRAKFDNSLENIGKPGSNYAYGIGFASGSSGPLDKFKMTVGEGGIRSPLLVSGPGIKGGRQVEAFAYVTDIMPTILELTGLEYPAEFRGRRVEAMRGRSMLGLLEGSGEAIYDSTEFVGGEMGGGRWMRQGDYKAVMIPPPYGSGEWQLFDVVKDPGEAQDLSNRMPDRLDELRSAWDRYAKDVGVILPEE
jgi:arylsulfatase